MAASLGKMPTTSVLRLISPLRRSSGLLPVMRFLGAYFPRFRRRRQAYGETIRDRGTGSTQSAGRPMYEVARFV